MSAFVPFVYKYSICVYILISHIFLSRSFSFPSPSPHAKSRAPSPSTKMADQVELGPSEFIHPSALGCVLCSLINPTPIIPDPFIMNAAARGDEASAKSDYRLAIEHYTHALSELPRAPAYYISRSTAYSRLKPADGGPDYQSALNDAEIALHLAKERGNRELIISAQMRRAVSLYQLERYGDAGFVLMIIADKTKIEKPPANRNEEVQATMGGPGSGWGGYRNNYSTQLPIWMNKLRRKEAEIPGDDPKRIVSVHEFPSFVYVPSRGELNDQWMALKAGNVGIAIASQQIQPQLFDPELIEGSTLSREESMLDAYPQHSSSQAAAPSMVPENVRHEWYQSQDSVVVTFYAKGILNDSVGVDLKEDFVSILLLGHH